ncbi:hypothetical protein D9M71_752940 [compost metagenome]
MPHDLLAYDLSGFNIRAVPQTRALMQQKIKSLSLPAKFIFDRLKDGEFFESDNGWQQEQPRHRLADAFAEYASRSGSHQRNERHTSSELGAELRRIFGNGVQDTRPTMRGCRVRCWFFPDLNEARKLFNAWLNGGKAQN